MTNDVQNRKIKYLKKQHLNKAKSKVPINVKVSDLVQ